MNSKYVKIKDYKMTEYIPPLKALSLLLFKMHILKYWYIKQKCVVYELIVPSYVANTENSVFD